MSTPPTRPPSRKHILAFRLSETEYQTLINVARLEKRKLTDLVYVMVTEALEGYAKRLTASAHWRASAHRLLQDLGDNEESRLEVRILRLLSEHPPGLTPRSIYRALRSPRKPVTDALNALEQDGRLRRVPTPNNGQPGPRPDVYQLLES